MERTLRRCRSVAASAVAVTVAVLAVLPAAAGASATTTGSTEAQLMQQLQLRATQLADLSKEVSAATALTPSDQGALEQKLAASTTSINGLIQAVPSDDTSQLRQARRTMIYQNRVFAVLTPQVYEVIASDTAASQAATLAAEEPALQDQVNADNGQIGYRSAETRYSAFVRSVSFAESATARVSSHLLAQTPQDFPRDRGVFVRSNREILSANYALARASYEKTLIALATNGYTGS